MLNLSVNDIMNEHPIKVRANVAIRDVAHLLLRYRINGILVCDPDDQDKILGIFTTGELLGLMGEALSQPGHKVQALDEIADQPVGNHLPAELVTLQQNDTTAKAVMLMHKKGVLTVPVYDGDKLVGVIGRHDIINIAYA